MKLTFFDSLTKEMKELPKEIEEIRMYVCGPTVYDKIHMGNARPLIVFDVLYRLLKKIYPRVVYVRNITDIDDKIINRSAELGMDWKDLAERMTKYFHNTCHSLNILSPTFEPRATDYISKISQYIKILLEKKFAYITSDGIYFDTAKCPCFYFENREISSSSAVES